jgi:hypothetical protein
MSIGTRLAIAFVLGLIAAVGVPQPKQAAPTFVVEDVSDEMKTKVADVARALKAASPAERAIWASVWEKAAVVVAGDAVTTEVIFTDTRSLRGFTVLSLDIAWRRLGGVKAGQYPGLREGVEKAMGDVVGLDVKPVTPDLRRAYGEACRAIAWAGYGNGG